MIIRWRSHKFASGNQTFATGYVCAAVGGATKTVIVPRYPRLPLIPESPLPKVWVMYFQELQEFLRDHIEDNQIHAIK